MKTKRFVFLLLLAFVAPWTASLHAEEAIFETIDSDSDEVTADGTPMSWDDFAYNVQQGNTYSGKTVTLNKDISVYSTVGDKDHLFQGTFDGQGHTITVDYRNNASTSIRCAPFNTVSNATFKDLKIKGTMVPYETQTGGFVGYVAGNTTFINCVSDVDIESRYSGDDTSQGGFVGQMDRDAWPTATFTGCAFTGSFSGSKSWGGFVGWNEGSAPLWAIAHSTVIFNDCVFAPRSITNVNESDCATFARSTDNNTSDVTVNNSYYTYELGTPQGKQARSITLVASPSEGGTVGHGTSTATHNVSGITAFGTGIEFDGIFYAGSGEQISVTATANLIYRFTAWSNQNNTTISTDNPYTFTMPGENTTLTASFEQVIATLPYTCDFEDATENGKWELANGSYTNYWMIGSSTSSSASHSLYITNDGSTYGYTVQDSEASSYVYAYRKLYFPEAGSYKVSFKWKARGEEECYDAMFAALVPDGTACPPLTDIKGYNNYLPSGYINAGDVSQSHDNTGVFLWTYRESDWRTSTKTVDISEAGIFTLVFYWKNDLSQGENPPAAVDDISVGTFTVPHTIATATDWSDFCAAVNGGHDYSGETVTMTQDVGTATAMCGTSSDTPFKGTFDGGGKTLTVDISGYAQGIAPFQYISGATLRNLIVTGTVSCDERHGGGLVGFAADNTVNTLQNCLINTDVSIKSLGGGIIGHGKSATVNIIGCAFNGQITNTTYDSSTNRGIGGLVGWCDLSATLAITNSVFAGTYIRTYPENTEMLFHPVACATQPATNVSCTLSNVYYTFGQIGEDGEHINIVANDGRQAYTITGGAGVTVTNAGTVSNEYNASGLTFHNSGFKFGDVLYADNGKNVSLNLSCPATATVNYQANAGTLSGAANPYTLAMPNSNVVIDFNIIREIAGYGNSETAGWAFIASPVEGSIEATTVGNIFSATQYDLYRFNPSADLEWENWKQEGGNYHFNLTNGRGYLYATKETKTLVFSGNYNMDDTKTIENLPQGFNLVGNPFMVDAYVSKPYYTLNSDGSVILSTTSTAAIAPCHGVIVEVEDGENVTFSTTEPTQQSANNGSLLITLQQAVEPVETPLTKVGPSTSSGTLTLDNAIVSFNEGSQLGKYYFGRQNANIYLPQGGEEYAIVSVGRDVARNVSIDTDVARYVSTEIPINFKASENGTYTLLVVPQGVELDYLHLIDNLTGEDVDLLAPNHEAVIAGEDPQSPAPSYTFTAKTTDYESRFKLVFVCEDENDNNDAPFAYLRDLNPTGGGRDGAYHRH